MNCQDNVLATLVNKSPSNTLTLRLYSNSHTPSGTTSKSDLVEVEGSGYAPVRLTGKKWTIKDGVAEYPPVEFNFTDAAGKIVGYYLTKDGTNDLLLVQKFKETVQITAGAQKIILTPRLKR